MRGAISQIEIPAGPVSLEGELSIPPDAKGLALFAHGSGSSRHSPRNQFVAGILQRAGIATLLFDLLTSAGSIASILATLVTLVIAIRR